MGIERFENRDGGLPVDGEVVTGVFGADRSRGKWLAGVALSVSEGEGGMRPRGMAMTYDLARIMHEPIKQKPWGVREWCLPTTTYSHSGLLHAIRYHQTECSV